MLKTFDDMVNGNASFTILNSMEKCELTKLLGRSRDLLPLILLPLALALALASASASALFDAQCISLCLSEGRMLARTVLALF